MASSTNSLSSAVQAGADAVENPIEAAHQSLTWLKMHRPELIDAAAVLVFGLAASIWLGRVAYRAMGRRNLEPPIQALLVRLMRIGILGLAITIALDNLGFKFTALIAGAGVVGVGVGFGMQTMVGNMVAGLTLIFTKPFRLGEYVEILSVRGVVTNINLMTTTLLRGDLSRVIIPNQKIIGDVLHNFGVSRQLELTIGVGYQSDLKKAQALALELTLANARVLREPAPGVSIGGLGDSSVTIKVNAWVKLSDFGPAQSEIYQAIVERFREQQIDIPFPQREISVLNPSPSPSAETSWH
jgi:small conductance mechanosensitive channel